jgi:hypothetical protein
MNVDDNQNDGLADIDLLAGGEQSEETVEEQEGSETGSDTETEDTSDDAEGDEEGSEDENEGNDDDKPKRRRTGSERLKRRIASLEAELRNRTSVPAAGDEAAISRAVEERIGKPPKQEDFTDYLEFERAATAYELDKRQASREVRSEIGQAQTRQEEHFQDLVADHKDRLQALEKVLPGARKTIQSLNKEISPGVGTLILESEKSALIAFHLAKNPEKLAELNGLSERAAAREIGRLEARLSLPKPKTSTSAPPPITPPRGSAALAKDPSKMSLAEYRAWRQKGGGK